jgi:hypothetical protein
MTDDEKQLERTFLHDLSNLLAKVQGKNMIASMKIDKVDTEEIKQILASNQTHIDEMVKVLNQRKIDLN